MKRMPPKLWQTKITPEPSFPTLFVAHAFNNVAQCNSKASSLGAFQNEELYPYVHILAPGTLSPTHVSHRTLSLLVQVVLLDPPRPCKKTTSILTVVGELKSAKPRSEVIVNHHLDDTTSWEKARVHPAKAAKRLTVNDAWRGVH